MQEVSRLAEVVDRTAGSEVKSLSAADSRLRKAWNDVPGDFSSEAGVSEQLQLAVSLGPPAPTSEFFHCGTALIRLR